MTGEPGENALPGNPSPIDSASYMKYDQINRYMKETIYHLEGVGGSSSSNDALELGAHVARVIK